MSFSEFRIWSKIKNRKGRFPLFRFFIFITIFVFVWKVAREHKNNEKLHVVNASIMPAFDPLDKKIEESLQKPINFYLNKLSRVVKPGDSFFSILSEYEISRDKANDIYKLLKPLGLNTIFPGDSVIVHKKSDGTIEDFSILNKAFCWYKVSWTDSVVKAEKKPTNISTYKCLINGILETSLSEAMQQCGISDAITGKFADIFGWDINFFTDPRRGDVFQIVFEQKYAEGKFIGYGNILAARYITNSKTFYAFGYRDTDGVIKYYDENGKAVQKLFLKAPLRYSRISSGFTFHRKHPILGIVRPHLGIDYAAPSGTPVSAAADGKVFFAGWNGGFGKLIILSHGGSYETYYGHLQNISVKVGEYVKQGDEIGNVGATGMATGPHLDYRMKRGQTFVNPNTISLPSNLAVEAAKMDDFNSQRGSYSILFNKRFTEQIGVQILEIETLKSTDAVVYQTCGSKGASDVNTASN